MKKISNLLVAVVALGMSLAHVGSVAAPIKLSGSTIDFYLSPNAATYATSYKVEGDTLVYSYMGTFSPSTRPLLLGFELLAVARDGKQIKSDVEISHAGRYSVNGIGPSGVQVMAQSFIRGHAAGEPADIGLNAYSNFEFSINRRPTDSSSITGSFDPSTMSGLQGHRIVEREFVHDGKSFDTLDINNQWYLNASLFTLGSPPSATLWIDEAVMKFTSVDRPVDVPEPASLALLGIGAVALIRRRIRR